MTCGDCKEADRACDGRDETPQSSALQRFPRLRPEEVERAGEDGSAITA